VDVFPGDTNVLKIVFGEQAQAVVEYVTGGFARDEDIAVLKVDYAQTRSEMSLSGMNLRDAVQAIAPASTPEEAERWICDSQNPSADNYYFMPYREDEPYSRLYIYRMSEVEKYADAYGYEVPEDRAELYGEAQIPVMMTMEYVGK